jgi:4-amino-4-deoxy-L-arabinose transferase-like glycosyltransferase
MNSPTSKPHTLEYVALAIILLVAGVARMGWPGLTEFKADEARLLGLALDMAEGQFQWRGISSSVGFPNFPMSVWLYALPLIVWPHPYAATLFTGLLNTISVFGCYWLVRRYWGATAALSAALLYAVSPWAIIYSRKIWAQDLLPLFVVGWAIGAALAFVESRRRWIVVHLLCLAVAIQIHLSAVALLPATGVFLFVFRRRVNWRMVAVGALLAMMTAAPFLVYLRQQWQAGGQAQLSLPGGGPLFLSIPYAIQPC